MDDEYDDLDVTQQYQRELADAKRNVSEALLRMTWFDSLKMRLAMGLIVLRHAIGKRVMWALYRGRVPSANQDFEGFVKWQKSLRFWTW